MINILNVVDGIDYSSSIPDRNIRDYVAGFDKTTFIEERVKDQTIFKLPEFPDTRTYVTDALRDVFIKAKLKGLQFIEVWESEVSDSRDSELQSQYNKVLLKRIQSQAGEHYEWQKVFKLIYDGKVFYER